MENRTVENGKEKDSREAAKVRRKKNMVEISFMLLGAAAGAILGIVLQDVLTWSVVGLGLGIIFGCTAANRNAVKRPEKE